MSEYEIRGSIPLKGTVKIGGSKNAVLPIMAATVLTSGRSTLKHVPRLKDVDVMQEVLTYLGASITRRDDELHIDTTGLTNIEVPERLMRKMRATIFLMGPLLARFGKVRISQPGGCCIGSRPINWHLKGLRNLGGVFQEEYGYIVGEAGRLQGTELHLDFPSVGTTENIMMAAVLAEGTTIIRNAAKEPEIVDLQNFLNSLGARIIGAGTDTIKVLGVNTLEKNVDYTVIPDRIEAGTYLLAGAITRGEVWVEKVIPEHLEAVIAKLQEVGFKLIIEDEKIGIMPGEALQPVDIKTLPYPGFPTDLQPQFMALLTTIPGISLVTENIFDGRLKHSEELARMGALIQVEGCTAIIKGGKQLQGTSVECTALRSGAALVLAGLAARGITRVKNIYHIERGYQDIEKKLLSLGARIRKVN